MKLLIVGYGKMGRMVEELAVSDGFEIAGRVDQGRDEWADADVAIDFSTADALLNNFTQYVARRLPVVIGTTGWNAHLEQLRSEAERAGIGVVSVGELFHRREHLRASGRRGRADDGRSAAIRRMGQRDPSRREARRPIGHGVAAAGRHDRRWIQPHDRHVIGQSRYDPWHAHRWIRQRIGYDRVDSSRPRSSRFRGRCVAGGAMDQGPHWLVFDAGRLAGLKNETEPRTKPRAQGREPTEDRRSSCVPHLQVLGLHSLRRSLATAPSMRQRSSAWRAGRSTAACISCRRAVRREKRRR